MNRFKESDATISNWSSIQRDFYFSSVLAGEKSKQLNPNVNKLKVDNNGEEAPISILHRRYLQLRDTWYNDQPNNFKDVFEVNTYCSEASAYVSKLETMIEGVKTMYREQWYREQYWTMSKHGFHALLAGTHSIFVLYKILKWLFYIVFIVTVGLMVWDYLDVGKKLSHSDVEFLVSGFLIAFGIAIMEVILHTIFGKNHQQIIRDNIKKQAVPDSAFSTHLLTITQDTKKLRDDIDFFQQQWIKKLGG